jgi:hypothetical protein
MYNFFEDNAQVLYPQLRLLSELSRARRHAGVQEPSVSLRRHVDIKRLTESKCKCLMTRSLLYARHALKSNTSISWHFSAVQYPVYPLLSSLAIDEIAINMFKL